jgi:hypothetical protein
MAVCILYLVCARIGVLKLCFSTTQGKFTQQYNVPVI